MTEPMTAAAEAAAVSVRRRDRWLLRLAVALVVVVVGSEPVLVGGLYNAVGQIHDLRATIKTNDSDSRDRAAVAAQERAALSQQIDRANGDLEQLQTDNDVLRRQLQRAGITPAVPRRTVTPTTTPAVSAPTAPPRIAPTTTTTAPCQVCAMSVCVTTPPPICP